MLLKGICLLGRMITAAFKVILLGLIPLSPLLCLTPVQLGWTLTRVSTPPWSWLIVQSRNYLLTRQNNTIVTFLRQLLSRLQTVKVKVFSAVTATKKPLLKTWLPMTFPLVPCRTLQLTTLQVIRQRVKRSYFRIGTNRSVTS